MALARPLDFERRFWRSRRNAWDWKLTPSAILRMPSGILRRRVEAVLALLACVLAGGLSQTGVEPSREEVSGSTWGDHDGEVLRRATFYVATGGWTVVGWSGVVGPMIRYKVLCAEDDGDRAWFWSAPPTFLSSLPGAFGASLEIGQGFFEVNRGGGEGLPARGYEVSIESDSPPLALRRFNLVRYPPRHPRLSPHSFPTRAECRAYS